MIFFTRIKKGENYMNTEEKKQCILMIIADLVGSGIKELIKEVLRTIIL